MSDDAKAGPIVYERATYDPVRKVIHVTDISGRSIWWTLNEAQEIVDALSTCLAKAERADPAAGWDGIALPHRPRRCCGR